MEAVTVTVDQACAALGIGRTKLYELVSQPNDGLRAIKCGRRTLITTASIREFVASREAA
ncbi:helix-turn-helix domain-containing protein [Croceicoccus gelatinilyticus]|uniref:helix-turn-helix domain-containing protein n=1 Tax=Croceicoccus gelatinilyticus TaxID=2835536 RepID=UPI001BCE9640|nr:helix-turn-helix domain-containing protein [Croceicoccus gelatinilyticus]MBS7668809.1 helix-turn-helix domain-containing protein [Croceicoccus gelatinilyticus]